VVKIQELPSGQYVLTIPKSLIKFLGLKKGDNVEFNFIDGKIVLNTKKEDEKTK